MFTTNIMHIVRVFLAQVFGVFSSPGGGGFRTSKRMDFGLENCEETKRPSGGGGGGEGGKEVLGGGATPRTGNNLNLEPDKKNFWCVLVQWFIDLFYSKLQVWGRMIITKHNQASFWMEQDISYRTLAPEHFRYSLLCTSEGNGTYVHASEKIVSLFYIKISRVFIYLFIN